MSLDVLGHVLSPSASALPDWRGGDRTPGSGTRRLVILALLPIAILTAAVLYPLLPAR